MTTISSPHGPDLSANGSPIFTLFDTETTDRLTRDHILRVAVGVLGAVHIRGFSALEDCRDMMTALDTCELGAYDEQLISPRIAKLGPAAYDSYASRELDQQYWDCAAQATKTRSTLLRGGDPMDYAMDRLREAWGGGVRYAQSGGRSMFAGMIREISNGAKLHFDEITRELPGILDETPASFLTLNWYLSMPEQGGETSVFRRRWHPADEADRDGYGYSETVVADEPVATVHPEAGDAVIFDTRNLHLVRPSIGSGRRISVSFFLGISGSGHLILWS